MKVSQITSANFGAAPIKILSAENKHISKLTNIVMEATSVYGQYRSGTVFYHLGKSIEIAEPAKGLAEYLKKLGIILHI